jgi:hypothetical protein
MGIAEGTKKPGGSSAAALKATQIAARSIGRARHGMPTDTEKTKAIG